MLSVSWGCFGLNASLSNANLSTHIWSTNRTNYQKDAEMSLQSTANKSHGFIGLVLINSQPPGVLWQILFVSLLKVPQFHPPGQAVRFDCIDVFIHYQPCCWLFVTYHFHWRLHFCLSSFHFIAHSQIFTAPG